VGNLVKFGAVVIGVGSRSIDYRECM